MKWDDKERKKFIQSEYEKLKRIIGEKKARKYVNDNDYNFNVVGMALFFERVIKFAKKHPTIAIIGIILIIALIIYFIYDRYFLY
ncbi:MAG TPA: hypothetical protein VJ937_09710 [Salinivirga sp.]|uniref:hypothetical protein n=1 Tax=Salinivirga sp. TaxID=1970192 RepID=UPI002B49A389|nr:hypothetical protein [Salinivirga sp.]HKK59744.1 hypothetical protein [Salinivirga sp.]